MGVFSIIGYYPDNDQVYSGVFTAADCEGALAACRDELEATLEVVAVVEGSVSVVDSFTYSQTLVPRD